MSSRGRDTAPRARADSDLSGTFGTLDRWRSRPRLPQGGRRTLGSTAKATRDDQPHGRPRDHVRRRLSRSRRLSLRRAIGQDRRLAALVAQPCGGSPSSWSPACSPAPLAFFILYRAISIPDANADFQTQTTKVYYSDGKHKIGELRDRRTARASRSTRSPPRCRPRSIAAEDRTFYTNRGIDLKGIIRAAAQQRDERLDPGGGSTITQQYVKILYLNAGALLHAQGQGGDPLDQDPQPAEQEGDPRGLPQHDLLRQRLLRRRGRVADLLRQAGRRSSTTRSRPCSPRSINSPSVLRPVRRGRRGPRPCRATTTCSTAWSSPAPSPPRRPPTYADKLPKVKKQRASPTASAARRATCSSLVKQADAQAEGFTDSQIDGGGLRIVTTFDYDDAEGRRRGGQGDASRRASRAATPPLVVGRSPARARCARCTAAPTTSRASSTGRCSARSPARRSRRSRSSRRSRTATASDQAQRQLAAAASRATPRSRTRATAAAGPSARSRSRRRPQESGQHRVRRPHATRWRTAARRSIEAARAGRHVRRPRPSATTPASPSSRSATRRSRRSTWPTRTRRSRPTASAPTGTSSSACATVRASDLHKHNVRPKQAIPRTSPPTRLAALQDVVRGGIGTNGRTICPTAGKTGTATARRRTARRSATPRLVVVVRRLHARSSPTAVMYNRGKGNEELEGYMPTVLRRQLPGPDVQRFMNKALDGGDCGTFPPPANIKSTRARRSSRSPRRPRRQSGPRRNARTVRAGRAAPRARRRRCRPCRRSRPIRSPRSRPARRCRRIPARRTRPKRLTDRPDRAGATDGGGPGGGPDPS